MTSARSSAIATEPEAIGGLTPQDRGIPEQAASSPRFTVAVSSLAGLTALALALYPISSRTTLFGVHPWPHGYDDGVYLGVAERLVNGVLPYRDFLFLQPPGIAIVMSPVALIGRVFGTHEALGIARLLSAGVAGANAALAAFALRSRGRIAMIVGGGALALYPLTAAATTQDDLEPFIVLFCLLGIIRAFDARGRPRRSLLGAGALLGFATAIKLPAAAVPIALAIALVPQWRRVRDVAVGAIAGFVVPSAVFFAAAPALAFREVIIDQVHRADPYLFSPVQRLVLMAGIGAPANVYSRAAIAVTLFVALGVATALAFTIARRHVSTQDRFVLLAAVAVVAELLLASQFYDHYAYFPAAFVALLLGTNASLLVSEALRARGGARLNRAARWSVGVAAVLVLAALCFGLPHVLRYEQRYTAGSLDPIGIVDRLVPPGSCMLSDEYTILLASNRFTPSSSGCPAVIDPYGLFIADDSGHPPPGKNPPASFSELWRGYLDSANATVFSTPFANYIPWNPSLEARFNAQFHIVFQEENATVYVRTTTQKG